MLAGILYLIAINHLWCPFILCSTREVAESESLNGEQGH